MIGSLRGEVIEKTDTFLLLDVGGVGYLVNTPTPVLDTVDIGESLFLRTYLHVRENALTLFGFNDAESMEMFEALLQVQGIGPKVALAIQSHLSNEAIKQAVGRGEAAILSRVPGIGPKKAKQIAFQLKGKITFDDVFAEPIPISDDDGEVIAALTALGYSIVEAQTALQNLPEAAKSEQVEEKIRLALSGMSKI
ncbi:MAG: Holliday junction branch migration protein RuvA [Chloroflexota bacterium]